MGSGVDRWVSCATTANASCLTRRDDNLSILDLENIILTGEVADRQRDAQTREVKCVITGAALDGSAAEAVVKLGPTGKLVIVTVYVC